MNLIYKRLFHIDLSHDYYAGGKARNLRLLPTADTEKLLTQGRFLFKVIPTGAVVLYRAMEDEVSPFIDMGKDLTFTFFLETDNKAEFFNITDLDESPIKKFRSSNIIYFRNDSANASTDPDNPEVVEHRIIDSLREPLFTYEFQLPGSPAKVKLKVANEAGNAVSVGKETDGTFFPTTLTVFKSTDDVYRQQIDLRFLPTGKYTITITNDAETTDLKKEIIYLDGKLAAKGVLGIIKINYNKLTDHIYGDPEQYQIQFYRKQTIWKYYIVDKNEKVDLATNDLLITDTGSGGGDPYNTYNFTREGAEPHADIKINGFNTVIFKSDTPIPFYEQPKLNLELRKNPGSHQVIVNLPNPSHSGVIKDDSGASASEVYVFI